MKKLEKTDLSKVSDIELVKELRARGYEVTAVKKVEL